MVGDSKFMRNHKLWKELWDESTLLIKISYGGTLSWGICGFHSTISENYHKLYCKELCNLCNESLQNVPTTSNHKNYIQTRAAQLGISTLCKFPIRLSRSVAK